MMLRCLLPALFAFLSSSTTLAQSLAHSTQEELASPLSVEHWIKGTPFSSFERGRVYVIEFWASSCAPCLPAIDRLSSLQRHYAEDVTVLAVSREPTDRLKTFLERESPNGDTWMDRMHYSVGTDPDGSTHGDFFHALGLTRLPSAVVVGRTGHIEWYGKLNLRPTKLRRVVSEVVGGTFDRESFRQRDSERMRLESNIVEAIKGEMPEAVSKAVGAYLESSGIDEEARLETLRVILHLGNVAAAATLADAIVHRAEARGELDILQALFDRLVHSGRATPELNQIAVRAFEAQRSLSNLPMSSHLAAARLYDTLGHQSKAWNLANRVREEAERRLSEAEELLAEIEESEDERP